MYTPRLLPFKMGCDPEFNVTILDKKIDCTKASKIIKKEISTEKPIKSIGGSLGDDANELLEMRPKPSNDIIELANNIKTILAVAHKELGMFGLTTYSLDGSCVGGHIHIGIGEKQPTTTEEYMAMVYQIFSFYLPIMLGEDQENNRLRGDNKYDTYGHFGDLRFEKKTGEYTCEIRTPTAEWMTTPKVMIATFAYVATIMNEILNNPKNLEKFSDFMLKDEMTMKNLERKARDRNWDYLNPILEKIKAAVETFQLYGMFKKEIKWLFDFEKVKAEKQKANFNAFIGWGFNKKPTVKEISNKQKLLDSFTDINDNYERVKKWVPQFCTNKDPGVSAIVHDIQKTIITKKWHINKKYVFYGTNFNQPTITSTNRIYFSENLIQNQELIAHTKYITAKLQKRFGFKDNEAFFIGIPNTIRGNNDFHKILPIILQIENNSYLDRPSYDMSQIKAQEMKKEKRIVIDMPTQYSPITN